MENFVVIFISSLITTIAQIYATSKLLNTSFKLNNFKKISLTLIIVIVTSVLFLSTESFMRVVLVVMILILFNYEIFNKSLNSTIIATFLTNTAFAISEICFALFFVLILNLNIEQDGQIYFGRIGVNLFISILVCCFVNIPFIQRKLKEMVENTHNEKKSLFIIITILGVFLSSVLIYGTYYKFSVSILLIVVLTLITIYSYMIYQLFVETQIKDVTENKNIFLANNIAEYEKIINVQKIEMHENKNQLRIIREMIDPKNKEVLKYIEELLNEKAKKDVSLINKLEDIPYSSLKALIYSKLINLDKTYNLTLLIDKKINVGYISSLNMKDNKDLCNIIGVFLDNAIEAASETAEKLIGIDISCTEKKLKISISNSFIGNIDIDKLDKVNYSTKGTNRGYGLPSVQLILKNNKRIENKRKIVGDVFIQYLYISTEN